ncbi:Cobalt-zinc-cadmium resistance protein CzcB [BD1-7 clade bacterium]|uniref:Cobalt-zinc-cadmium resistance protein CzcB n=1 Tax=BD1-7 clade bacterium TaxID=2029982 RepID=A0A5S9QZ97_9GAMM|nr:Cobalt-zinc-cadmium resistance protein CzcB [BD1-7 clade bacterium]
MLPKTLRVFVKPTACTLISLAAAVAILPSTSLASGGHAHDVVDAHAHEERPKGPHGGTMVQEGDYAVEVTIFETGIPPEMRLYLYKNGEPLAPAAAEVGVELVRLGGDIDELTFIPEQDYLVSQQSVAEPHSYDVDIHASFGNDQLNQHYESHEGRTELSQRIIDKAGIKTAKAGPATLVFSEELFGVIAAPEDKVFRINAPYAGIVSDITVNVGDTVKKGQLLARVRNTDTLQNYNIKSPVNGEVTMRRANPGDRAQTDMLLEVTSLDQVWVEMSAFPEHIEKLAPGMKVTVSDMHKHEQAIGKIEYVAPVMTGGHIARARAVIDNSEGHWRPGMHIKARIDIGSKQVPLAVKNDAIQSFREMPVVFGRFGDTFEVRMIASGETDGVYTEVLGGLKPGTEYATDNSFIIKADVLKSGASHDH